MHSPAGGLQSWADGWGPTVSPPTDSGADNALTRWGPTVWGATVGGLQSLRPPILEIAMHSLAGRRQSGGLQLKAYNLSTHRSRSWQRIHWLGAYSLGASRRGLTISPPPILELATYSLARGLQSGGLELGAYSLSAHRFWSWQRTRCSWGPTVWGPTVGALQSLRPPMLERAMQSPVLNKSYRGTFNVNVVEEL